MKSLIKILPIILISFLMSCNSTKPSTATTKSKDEKNFLKEGYILGEVEKFKGQCSYIIIDQKGGVKYDPINIDHADFSVLKETNKKVYFKFHSLRMANRCVDVLPIELTEIILVE